MYFRGIKDFRSRWHHMDERIGSTPPIATVGRLAHRTIQRIARRAVPELADFAVVFMVTGRSIVGIASAHASPAGNKLLRALQRVYHIRRDDLHSTVAQVVRTGEPSLRRTILQETVADAPRGSVADLHRRLACRSALVLPIRVGNTVTGAVSLCYAGSGRTYAATDLADARRIAREIERTPPPLLNATSRLRAATGDARRQATVRRRVAPRN
jgi:GAF domain-containing protein